jgi:DNA-binding CsgD family transcriptional regulator
LLRTLTLSAKAFSGREDAKALNEISLQPGDASMRLRKIDPTKIPALLANGLSAAEIADELGCTEGSLRVRCSQLKISLRQVPVQPVQHGMSMSAGVKSPVSPPAGSRRRRPSKIDPKRIPLLLDRGLTSAEIAAEFGCTLGTLRVKCSRLRISLRQPRKAPDQMHSKGRQPSTDVTSHKAAASLRPGNGNLDVALPASTIGELRQRAAAMGVSTATLAASLLETISRDCLYSAVLDAD